MSLTQLQNLAASHAAAGRDDLAKTYQDMAILYERKLFHQLTNRSLELIHHPFYAPGTGGGADEMLKLCATFFRDMEPRAKPLSMAQIMVAVAQQHKTPAEQIAFLEKKANDLKANPDSLCLLLSTAAAAYTAEKNFDKAKTTLERVESLLNGAFGLDPIVYSTFYRVLAVFHKAQVHAGEFYKAGLLYLAYTPVESMPLTTQQMMARDLALAGLVAEDVFGLGELLSHPVAQALRDDAENAWLLELVNAFNSGKIGEWSALKTRHSGRIQQQPTVLSSMELLEEKIRVLALIELVWSRPADGRTLSFGDIGAATHLAVERVELLVMRALALGLLKGEIDQVQGVVLVTQVLPRVLSFDQIAAAKERVKYWREHVNDTLVNHMEPHHELLK